MKVTEVPAVRDGTRLQGPQGLPAITKEKKQGVFKVVVVKRLCVSLAA